MSTTFGSSIILGIIAMAITVVGGVKLLAAAQQAQVAADMSALSAALAFATGDVQDPCELAREFITAHRVRLTGCAIDGEDVRVQVSRLGRSAEAVAGPATETREDR